MNGAAPPKARKRRHHTKVRTGCMTCRRRRVKCDERKPICNRCTSSGHGCDGYGEGSQLSETQGESGSFPTLSQVALSSMSPGNAQQVASTREQMLYDYFRFQVVPQLDCHLSTGIWNHIILTTTHENAAAWHAAMALTALVSSKQGVHMQYLGDSKNAMVQYGAAIRILQHQLTNIHTVTPNGVLATCLLLIAFEFLQNGYDQAKTHVLGVLRLARDFKTRAETLPSSWKFGFRIDASLLRVYERLDVQIAIFTSWRTHLVGPYDYTIIHSSPRCGDMGDLASQLTSLFAGMCNLTQAISQDIEIPSEYRCPKVDAERRGQVTRLLGQLNEWDESMKSMQVSSLDQGTSRILRIQLISCKVLVACCLSEGREMIWDNFHRDFERLLDLAESALPRAQPTSAVQCLEQINFSLDMGVIPPLYFTAIKCRNRKLRRRAIDLMRRCHQREGAWQGELMAPMAEAVARLEERHSEHDSVEEHCRFYQAWYDLSKSGTEILYCKRKRFESDQEWVIWLEPTGLSAIESVS